MKEAMPLSSTRLVIYTKDIMAITGRKERAARKMLAAMKKKYGKDKDAFITVDEFCEFTGLEVARVQQVLTA